MLRWWWKCHRNFWRYQTSLSLFWTQVPRFAQCSIWISRCTCIWLLWSQGPVQELLKFPYHIRLETTPCLQQYCVSRSWTDPKFPISTQDLYSSCFRWLSVSSCGTLVTWATFSQKSEYCTIVGLLRLRLWGWFFFGITLLTQRVEAREGRWWAIEQSLERWWHHTQSLSHPIPQKNWKFERFHLDGGKVSFQNTQQIYLFPHRPQEKENWKAFTWMATKCLFKILYQIYLFPHRPQKK